MKLSKETRDILGNFATIGKGIIFRPGNMLATKTNLTTVLATAPVAETFTIKAPIFNLQRLLDVMAVFGDEAELDFQDKLVWVRSAGDGKKSKIRYVYSPENLVIAPPETIRAQAEADVQFDLTEIDRKQLLSAVSALNVKDIAIRSKEGTISVCAYEAKEDIDSTDLFSVEVGKSDEDFQFNFSTELFKVLPGDYSAGIHLADKGSLRLKRNDGLFYLIAGSATNA